MRSTHSLLFMLVACSSDPLEGTRSDLAGTWQARGGAPTDVILATFHANGDYEIHFRFNSQPESTQTGRWKLTGTKDKPQLQTCVDGVECKNGGIWKTEDLFVTKSALSTGSPNGGSKTDWFRYSKP